MNSIHEEPKYPVHSLEKAIRIIEYMRENCDSDGLTLHHISTELGMTKSSVHRILDTLVCHGLAERSDIGMSRYKLGWSSYRIGCVVPGIHPIEKSGYKPLINRLSADISSRVGLYILNRKSSICVYEADSGIEIVEKNFNPVRYPLYSSCSGKLFLLNYSEDEIMNYFKSTDIRRFTSNTILNYIDFLNELNFIRKTGFSMDRFEYENNAAYISVPIFDYTSSVKAAVSFGVKGIISPDIQYDELPDSIMSSIMSVKDVCRKISDYLGYEV